MGENEQGGMLRTVVVIGIVAMVALIITLGVVGLKNNMTKNTATAVYNIEKTPKPYPFENDGNIQFNKYQVTYWNGLNYYVPVYDNIQPGYWRELHATIAPETDATMQIDINAYDLDNPDRQSENNDADEVSKREIKMYENGTLVQNMDLGGTMANLKAGHVYQLLVKYHNDSLRTIYDSDTKQRTGSHSTRFVIGTPDGSPGKVKITDLEAATYKMP